VQAAKGYAKQDQALTQVLDAIHLKFPPAKLNDMTEVESVEAMQGALLDIRAELVGAPRSDAAGATAETPANVETPENVETAKAVVPAEGVETEEGAETVEGVNGVEGVDTSRRKSEAAGEGEEGVEEAAPAPAADAEVGMFGKKDGAERSAGPVTLADLASLADTSGAVPPAVPLAEAVAAEKLAEKLAREVKQKTREVGLSKQCLPRHPPHRTSDPRELESNIILDVDLRVPRRRRQRSRRRGRRNRPPGSFCLRAPRARCPRWTGC